MAADPSVTAVHDDGDVRLVAPVAATRVADAPTGVRRIGGGTSAAGVAVAVIDTGIDLRHPALNAASGVNCIAGRRRPFSSCHKVGKASLFRENSIALIDRGLLVFVGFGRGLSAERFEQISIRHLAKIGLMISRQQFFVDGHLASTNPASFVRVSRGFRATPSNLPGGATMPYWRQTSDNKELMYSFQDLSDPTHGYAIWLGLSGRAPPQPVLP